MRPLRARAQRSASRVSASESAPPETATARGGPGSKHPRCSITRAKSVSPSGAGPVRPPERWRVALRPPRINSAPDPLFFRDLAILDDGLHLREIPLEPGEAETSIVLAPGIGERHAELQQIILRLRALRVFLVPFGESRGGRRKIAAHEVGLAQPVLRVGGKRITRMLLQKTVESGFRALEVGVAQQTEGIIILLQRRTVGQHACSGRLARLRPRGRRQRAAGRGLPVHVAGTGVRPLRRRRHSPCRPRLGRRRSAMFQLLETDLVIGLLLFQTPRKLRNIKLDLFQLPGQRAQLGLQLIHADLDIKRAGTLAAGRGRCRTGLVPIYLTLQLIEISLQPVDAVLQGADIIRLRRAGRQRNRQQGGSKETKAGKAAPEFQHRVPATATGRNLKSALRCRASFKKAIGFPLIPPTIALNPAKKRRLNRPCRKAAPDAVSDRSVGATKNAAPLQTGSFS